MGNPPPSFRPWQPPPSFEFRVAGRDLFFFHESLRREAIMKEALIEKARVHEELRTMKAASLEPTDGKTNGELLGRPIDDSKASWKSYRF